MPYIHDIEQAWQEEGSRARLGMRPAADPHVLKSIIPAGGDWQCVAEPGWVTRRIIWRGMEVALINPRGDLNDTTEGDIAMGLRAMPALDKAMRAITVLAEKPENLELIGKIARAAIDYIEQPAPPIVEPEDKDE